MILYFRALVFLVAILNFGMAATVKQATVPNLNQTRIGISSWLASWQKFLTKYLDTSATDGVNRIRYAAVTASDKNNLQATLKAWQSLTISTWPQAEQRAFWINLYNAQTVLLILDHYPISSIRDIKLKQVSSPDAASKDASSKDDSSSDVASAGPWETKLIHVEGKPLSLNDIENGILRIQWKDNRIHFALNCASIGCPNLSTKVYTAENTEGQLEAQTRKFLQSPRALSLRGGKLQLSSIFDWYVSDFGGTEKTVLAFLIKYAPAPLAKDLSNWKGKIEYIYDWNLNDLKTPTSPSPG